MTEKPIVKIWTDGGCIPNPGKGGWAALLDYNGTRKVVSGNSGDEETTNNRCELMAMITALETLNCPCKVTLVSDSQYAVNVGSGEWNASSNTDLVERLQNALSMHDVKLKWKREFSTPEMHIVHNQAEVEARRAA